MDSIIMEVRSTAMREGISDGLELARKMLCKSIGKDIDSFGAALAHVDLMVMELERMKRGQAAID